MVHSTPTRAIYGSIEGDFVRIAVPTAGLLQERYVHRGQSVSAGEKLFSLDVTQLQSIEQQARADIARLQVEVSLAALDYERAAKLSETGAATEAQLDAALTQLLSRTCLLQSAEQQLKQAEKNLADACPTAPTAAIVQETYFEPGEFVPAGRPVISLLPPGNVKVRFFVPQSLTTALKIGQKIFLQADGIAEEIPAQINFISPQLEYTPPVIYSVESRSKLVVMVEAQIEPGYDAIRPGLPVSVIL